jgi:hypothetical protein
MEIILEWNKSDNKWHMMMNDKNNTFIQEFYNCENMQTFFDKPDKNIRNIYFLRKPLRIPQGE